MGFWIDMTEATTLTISGALPTTTGIPLLTTANGWNLVGYPSSTVGSLPNALSSHGVGSNFSLIYAYAATDGSDPWKIFDLTGSSYANDLTNMTSGSGYWIKVPSDSTWNVAY
jgi:hypothetical protein